MLLCGDCFEILSTIEPNSIDFICTDPPYFNTNLEFDKQVFDWAVLWRELKRVIKPNGVICIFSQIRPAIDVIISNKKWFRYQIVWKKTMPMGFLKAKIRPMRCHELILIFSGTTKDATYNPQMTAGKAYVAHRQRQTDTIKAYGSFRSSVRVNTGDRYPIDVLEFSNGNNKTVHPTQKPVPLMEWLIKTYSNPGELVLDPFAGSGSTLIACNNTNRRWIGIEKDPNYYQIASNRINNTDNIVSVGSEDEPFTTQQLCLFSY